VFPASRLALAQQMRLFASGAKALKTAKNSSKVGSAKIVAAKQAKAQQQQSVDPYMDASAAPPPDVPDTQTQKIVCSLTDLSKKLPNGNFLFRNISLSFFQGAKIGVIGINGAGKVPNFCYHRLLAC
jgi:ATPase subunit of ABC transporter with duplicated ATPase domains